jgi:hypothetical protein
MVSRSFGGRSPGINRSTETPSVLQLDLKGAKIEQGRSRQRVDKDVDIASLLIGAVRRRAEDARVRRAEPASCFANRNAMTFERDGRFQSGLLHGDRTVPHL